MLLHPFRQTGIAEERERRPAGHVNQPSDAASGLLVRPTARGQRYIEEMMAKRGVVRTYETVSRAGASAWSDLRQSRCAQRGHYLDDRWEFDTLSRG